MLHCIARSMGTYERGTFTKHVKVRSDEVDFLLQTTNRAKIM